MCLVNLVEILTSFGNVHVDFISHYDDEPLFSPLAFKRCFSKW